MPEVNLLKITPVSHSYPFYPSIFMIPLFSTIPCNSFLFYLSQLFAIFVLNALKEYITIVLLRFKLKTILFFSYYL